MTRFDGRNFKAVPEDLQRKGLGFNIRDLTLEPSGTLLLLPANGGVVRYEDGRATIHPVSATVAGKSLVDLYVEPNGALWLGTEDETVLRWREGALETFGPRDGINRRGNRFSFATDRDGKVWVAGGDFVGVYREGKLEPAPGVTGTSVVVAPARSGGIWISTFEHLLKSEAGRVVTIADTPIWPVARGTVHYLFEDRTGALWIATRRDGLFRLAGGKIVRVPTSSHSIKSVNEDREGNIWVSTEGGGIERLRKKSFVLVDHTAGLEEDVSTSVSSDATGALWCANRNGGLVRYFEGKIETVAASPVGTEFFAIATCADRDGHVWVAMRSGVYRVSALPPYEPKKIAALSPARVLFCARNGDLWVGSGEGELGYFRGETYCRLKADTGDPSHRVTAIAESRDGGVCIATRDGSLVEYRDDKFVSRLVGMSTATQARINTLLFDQTEALWIGTPEGLLLLRGTDLHKFTRADGLLDDYIDQLIQDEQGQLWIGSRRGLYHLTPSDLIARADTQHGPVSSITFGKDEGLAGTTSFSGEQPGTCKTADGRLWFTTHRGIVGLDTRTPASERSPHPVFIDEVRIDGLEKRGEIRLPPGNHRIDFQFVALNFSVPEKVRVRHQLVGMDVDWVETTSEHSATYARLPPGEYVMKAIACDQDGVWNSNVATLAILAEAAWWQTKWAWIGAFLGFTTAVVAAVRYVSQRRLKLRLEQLERENMLERERARIARDLHDELGGSLTQIRLLAERIKRHNPHPEFKDVAVQLVWRARRLGTELESIIWTVSPKNNTCDRLASFIVRFALKFFRDTAIKCKVSDPEEVPAIPLRPEEQHHLLAVAKEAFNNVLKHSQAAHADVRLECRQGVFRLVIRDDGIGFDPARRDLSACNGLNNMRARIREIGGTIEIESAPGQGTTISVHHRLRSEGSAQGTQSSSVTNLHA